MRRHLSYANVMATLGVFIALGGTSYAAVKITGKQVKNRSLTGQDIKKRSVPLNRLKGTLPAGPAGPVGPAGPAGATGDAGTPAPPEGVTSFTVPPSQWVSSDPELVPEYSSQRVQFVSTTASGSGFAILHPQLPTATGAGRTRVLAVRVCLHAQFESTLNSLYISQFRQTDFLAPAVGELLDPAPDQGPGCVRYALPSPFVMEKDDFLTVRFQAGWTATGAHVRVASTTIEYDRVQ